MSDPGKAVFLSYASQDAEAAKHICDALRAAGVEVWFDAEGGLEHGDEWDAKIRRQIKDCVLFLPIISANTQAREEGYFRIEWELAAQRALGIASGVAFILPIVIDDTREPDALVPDRFRTVQWTRLRGGELTPEVKARFLKLWSHRAGMVKHLSEKSVAGVADPGRSPASTRPATLARPGWKAYAGLAGAIFALVAVVGWWMLRRPGPSAPLPVVSAEPVAHLSLPRDWPKNPELKRAIALIEGLDSIPDDFVLAEQIVKPIVERAPADAEAVTVMARVQSHYLKRGFDRTDERADTARRFAERAVQLAPDEPEALYALACYLDSRGTDAPRAERLLRRAVALDPTNPRPGRELADMLFGYDRVEEALAQGQDNIRRFPTDVLSRYDLARLYKDQGRYEDFGRELEATLAIAPLPNAIVWKARLQFGLHNDFPAMKIWLDRVPERVRGTERAVFGYFLYAAFGGQAETGLAALRGFPQKWFTDFEYAGPTALLNASLLELQGRTELARQQYEAALAEIQKMRVTDPGRANLSHVEFWALLGLGRKEEARESYRRMIEGTRRPYAQSLFTGWWFTVIPGSLLFGERTTALALLRECVETRPEVRAAFRLRLQLDPRMAPFRDDPEIKALLAEPKSETVAAPLSEAGRLAARAVAFYSKLNYTREDLAVADDLTRKATELEAGSAAAWGARAGVQATYIYRNWDSAEKRRQDTQNFANRALALNPDEPEALLALGHLLNRQGAVAQAVAQFRRAFAADPANSRFARALATALSFNGSPDEGRAILLEAVRRDPRDPIVRYDLALTYDIYVARGGAPKDLTAAFEHLDAGLAVQPNASLLLAKAVVQGGWQGDLPAMRTTLGQLEKLPLAERAEDRAVYVAMWGGLLERNADRVLEAATLTAKNYLEDTVVPRRPMEWSIALAHRLQGKDNLARLDWQRAEQLSRVRLRDNPGNPFTVIEVAIALAWLGRADEAAREMASTEAAWREELNAARARMLALYYAALGDAARAAPYLKAGVNTSVFLTTKTLPCDPWFDKLRGTPEFEALLKETAKK